MRNLCAGLAVVWFFAVAVLLPGDVAGAERLLSVGLALIALSVFDWSRLPRPPRT